MAAEVRFAPGAEQDLLSLYVYVAERAGTAVADNYHARLRNACLSLADFPRRGTPQDGLSAGLRSVAFERRATIYYLVGDEAVEIVRVLPKGADASRPFNRD